MIKQQGKPQSLRDTVDDIMDRWRAGDPPNAQSVFDELPEVLQHHSLAIDLAYEEFCLKEESGEAPDPKLFCNKYSQLRHSLGRMLKLHGLMQSKSLGLMAEKSVDWPVAGERWLDWLLVEEIGRGAFSRVFVAEEPALGNRRVVVKCSISGPGEAFVLGKFSHPNVMPVHSIRADEQQDLVGICMPLLGRVTLAQVLDRVANSHPEAISPRVFSPEYGGWPAHVPDVKLAERRKYSLEVICLVERVARGLAAAHELKVLHGDIKPSNILLSTAGEPLLVDFNLSVAEFAPQQRLGGTPPYMAPERLSLLTLPGLQAAGNEARGASEPEYRSDVFSLGVVLYELLYGEVPYELQIDEMTARYEPVRKGDLIASTDVAGQPVSGELATIIRRSIALEPAARLASANEMAGALEACRDALTHRERVMQRRQLLALVAGGTAGAALAVAALTPAKMWNSDYWEIERIIALIEARDFMAAAERLQSLDSRRPRRELKAWRAYCSSQLEQFSNAEKLFKSAEPDQDRSGTTWFNIALCCASRGTPDAAASALDRSIELNPQLREAYWERAAIQLRIPRSRRTAAPARTFNDIRYAIETGPLDPYLLFDAAHVTAEFMKDVLVEDRPVVKARAMEYARLALEQGISPDAFKTSSAFRNLQIDQLIPTTLPPPAPTRSKADDFLPPAYDLRAIFE